MPSRSRSRLLAVLAFCVLGLPVLPNDAAASASPHPVVVSGYKDGPVNVPAHYTFGTMAQLPLGAGPWVVWAKAYVVDTSPEGRILTCVLAVGVQHERTQVVPYPNDSPAQVVVSVAGRVSPPNGAATLRCFTNGASSVFQLHFIKITALKAGRFTFGHQQPPRTTSTSGGSGVPRVVSFNRAGPVDVRSDALAPVMRLDPPPGRWAAVATFGVRTTLTGVNPNIVTRLARCRLGDGSHFTDVEIRLAPAHFVPDRLDGALDVAPLSGPVTLRCRSDGATGDVQARHIRITLIRPGTLTKVNMSSGTRTTTGSGIPDIVHGFLFRPVPVPGASALGTVARLHVGRGRWAVLAALWLHRTVSGASQSTCQLQAGASFDESRTEIIAGHKSDHVSMALEVVHRFVTSSPGTVVLKCASEGADGSVVARHIRITAIKAGTLTNTPLS